MTDDPAGPELAAELEDLRARLAEAEEVLRAIRNGEVDAVVVAGERGEQVYTLSGADRVYRQLIETMSEGAVTLSADGVILYCNVCLAGMLGRSLDEVLGTALRNHLPPADQQALDTILAQARTETSRREINLKTSEGPLVPVYLSASRLPSEGAEMIFCLVLTDLTEQKRHEQIVADERLARLILEQAAEAIVVCDEQGRIIRASQAAQRFCDGSPSLRPFAEVFPLRTDASDPFHLAPVLQGETLRSVDVALDRQGQKLDLILNAGPLLSGQQILGCVVTLTNISERKRAEAALRESERRFACIFEFAPDAIMMTNRQGTITLVNQRAEQIFGWRREELVGQPVELLVPKESSDSHAALQERYRQSPTVRMMAAGQQNLRAARKDGTDFPVEISLSPMESKEGGMVVAVVRDLTARVQLEAQLRQSQKMEAVGRLAGGIAHDFNNQIFVINGYCDLLLGEAAGQPAFLEPLVEIKKAARRSAALTAQLLAFSRKQVLQPKVLDLNAELMEVETMLRRLIGEDVQLTFVLGDDVGHVKVDPNQLQQVVMNLAVNARDAMPHGGQLTIETNNVELDEAYAQSRLEVTPGPYVLLSVSDTGHGMDRETLARIFEPFFSTKGPGKGTGLGLATALGVVKQSGGHIAVYSEPGQGTTFKIYLPRVDEPVETTERRVTEELTGGSETILLVEDETAVRELVRRVLAERGYQVLPAADGREALQLVERYDGPIHLLLTDVVMPEMSGSQLAERLKAVHPDTRVIYMSGYTENAIVHHGVLAAGLAFLPKPSPTDVLVRKVRAILDARPRKTLRGSRILVVDDSEDERTLQGRMLSKAGCVVLEASSGTAALAMLERETVDAVVTDVNMPGMDGFALTEAIRRSPRLQTLPVIILSGAYTEDEQARSRAVGATACLNKGTADERSLLEILGKVL